MKSIRELTEEDEEILWPDNVREWWTNEEHTIVSKISNNDLGF